jgi:DHA1 family bicyclomycin/chloramphenicol resistance-like MFS transporter
MTPLPRLKPDTFALTAVLAFLTALGPHSTDMYLPSLPDISVKLGATVARTQLTLSIFLLGFACGQVVYGPFSDRFGRRPVLLFGMGLFIVASALCAFATSIDLLIAARFLQALGASGPIVLARAIVRDLYEGPRAGRELARMGTIMGVVPAAAPVLGGVLQAAFGWRASFLVTIIGSLVLGAVVVAGLPETNKQRGSGAISPLGIVRSFASLLGNRSYRVYMALLSLAYAGLFAFISGSSFVLQGVYRLGEISYGFAFGFCVVGFITGTVLARRMIGTRGLDGTIGVGVAFLAAGGFVMLGCVLSGLGGPFGVILPMVLYTCGVGLVMPQSLAMAMQPFPDRAGAASSFVGLVQMLLASAVGAAVGQAIDGNALPLPMTMATTGLLAFAIFHLSRRIRARGA